jgi:hypothetical protein
MEAIYCRLMLGGLCFAILAIFSKLLSVSSNYLRKHKENKTDLLPSYVWGACVLLFY